MGDHTEIIEIDFDPTVVSYEDLLEVFWDNHNPFGDPWSRQYMSMILYHDDDQKVAAQKTRKARERVRKADVHTEIRPLRTFYMAEDYHQKYRLQNHSVLMNEIRRAYPNGADFVASTAAARLNGYLAGYGNPEKLNKGLESLGLSPEGRAALRAVLR